MGRWLTAQRERDNLKQPKRAPTKPTELAEMRFCRFCRCRLRVCEKSGSELTGNSVGFIGASCGSGRAQQPSPTRPDLSPEDRWAFYDERAPIREFDGKMPRTEAEALALQDTTAALGACPSDT